MFNNGSPSLADIAAVTGNNGGFNDGNGWWILIILFALFGGWGNRGYAGGSEGCATPGDLQRGFDQQTTGNMLRQLTYGLADSTYALNNAITNGFSNADLGRAAIQQAINDCCCQNREAIAQVRYDAATNACATQTAINQAAQQIMLNDNNNYRALHDEIVANNIAAKDAKIADQAAQIQALTLAASQQAQNNYIISQLRQTPVPAYTVPNPYLGYNYGNCPCNS